LNRTHAAKLNDAFQLGKGEIFSPSGALFFGGVDPQLKLRAIFGCSCGAKKACQKLDGKIKSSHETTGSAAIRSVHYFLGGTYEYSQD